MIRSTYSQPLAAGPMPNLRNDEAFAAYGLDVATITALRAWALEWADDLATRLLEEDGDPGID